MYAIVTKFLPATATLPDRIVATWQEGEPLRVVVLYSPLGDDGNAHRWAAKTLLETKKTKEFYYTGMHIADFIQARLSRDVMVFSFNDPTE